MKLKIRILDQDDVNLEVPDNASIDTLSKAIAEKSNMPTNQQRLIFRGQLMQPGSLLSDYGITDGCVIHMDPSHNTSRESSSATGTNNTPNSTTTSSTTTESTNSTTQPVASSSFSISMVLQEPHSSDGSSNNGLDMDMINSFFSSLANPPRHRQQRSSSTSSADTNSNTATGTTTTAEGTTAETSSSSSSSSSTGVRRRNPLGGRSSGDRRRRTNSNRTIHITAINSNHLRNNDNQQQQQQPPPPSTSNQILSSMNNSSISSNYNYIFEILSNTERRMSSLNNSLRQSPLNMENNNQTPSQMIGELLQKLMLILSESISPLLQLSELLLTNSAVDRNLINLVSSSLNEISMSSNCCSNLLLEYCRMNNGSDAEIQTDTSTSTATATAPPATTNTTTTTTATSIDRFNELCEHVSNTIHEVVEHKNDINLSLNSEENNNNAMETEEKE